MMKNNGGGSIQLDYLFSPEEEQQYLIQRMNLINSKEYKL
jgi:hypothetical protein